MNSIKFQPSLLLSNLVRPRLDEAQADKKNAPKNIGLDFFKSMQSQKTEMVSSRKQAAQARMAQLKAQIENALRFAHIGSGNPRMVAQLAKELKALVAQYGGSSGGAGNMVMPTINSEQGDTAQATASATSSTEQGAEQSVDAAQIAEAAQVAAEATAAAASVEETVTQEESAKAGQPEDRTENKTNTSPLSASRQGDAGDQAFFAQAKELAQKLKLLLAIEMQKVKTEADQKDGKIAKKEIDAVDEAIKKAEISVANEHIEITTLDASTSYDATGGISSSVASSVSTFV